MPDITIIPLVLTIHEAATNEPNDLTSAVLQSVVHSWMEGHLAAPGHQLDPDRVGRMPEPPFPADVDNPRLSEIIDDTLARFSEDEIPAAIAYASALGWQAGRLVGQTCPGCAPEGHGTHVAQRFRSGKGQLVFKP